MARGEPGRPRKTPGPGPTRGAAVPPTTEGDQDRAAEAFSEFIKSMPEDARVLVNLRRLPSYVHPQVTEPEQLPAPPFRPDFGEMQADVRRLYGPGRYRLYVQLKDEHGKNARFAGPVFFLAPTPAEEAGEAFGEIPSGRPPDPLDDALDRMASTAERESKAKVVAILQGKAEPTAAKGGLEEMKAWVEVLRAVVPQQPDAITLLKNLRDLIAPAGGPATPDATLTMIEKTVSILQGLGVGGGEGGARRSVAEVVVSGIVDLAKSWGPYLPAVVRAVGQVQQQVRAGGPAPPAQPTMPAPEQPKPLEGPSAEVLARAVGDSPAKQLAMGTLLSMVLVEMQTAQMGDPLALEDSFERVADFAEARLPGLCGDLVKMTPEQVWTLWVSLDPRVQPVQTAGPWLSGFLRFLASPPQPEGGSDEQ